MVFTKGNKAHLGIKHSKETKRKMSESKKKLYKNGLEIGFQKGNQSWKKRKFVEGKDHPQWKGGDEKTWTKYARRTLEKKYNLKWKDMYLPKTPHIHHIDGDKSNNTFENLCVVSASDHAKIHWEQGDIRGRPKGGEDDFKNRS